MDRENQSDSHGVTSNALTKERYLEMETNFIASDESPKAQIGPNDHGTHLKNTSSSLLERIRAKQQQQVSATARTASELPYNQTNSKVHPNLSIDNSNSRNDQNETASYLPINHKMPNQIRGFENSLILPASSTLKQDNDTIGLTQSDTYTYVSSASPPMEMEQPHTKNISNIDEFDKKTQTVRVLSSVRNGISAIIGGVKNYAHSEALSSFQYASLSEGTSSINEKSSIDNLAEMEAFGYTDMDGDFRNSYDYEDSYSMKGYLITFCNDIYNLTLGCLPKNVRVVIVAIVFVLLFWFLVYFL